MMQIDGRCHCGRVTYVADVDRGTVSVCHCTDCQVLSGSPWRASIEAAASGFRFTGAEPRVYMKTAASGRKRQQAFCADCGTPIYSAAEHDPKSFNLRLGAIVQRAQLTPDVQHWASSKIDWATDIHDLPVGSNS